MLEFSRSEFSKWLQNISQAHVDSQGTKIPFYFTNEIIPQFTTIFPEIPRNSLKFPKIPSKFPQNSPKIPQKFLWKTPFPRQNPKNLNFHISPQNPLSFALPLEIHKTSTPKIRVRGAMSIHSLVKRREGESVEFGRVVSQSFFIYI